MSNVTRKELRSGFTTGACAAAAAKGAALMLARQEMVDHVEIDLPAGVSAGFALHGQRFNGTSASCFVIKDAGDDPDVTNGAELHATVTSTPPPLTGEGRGVGEAGSVDHDGHSNLPPALALPRREGWDIVIAGGSGIGKVTKPGLAVAPGEWAINPVPRQMIQMAVRQAIDAPVEVSISIPDGEERARKTLNARLGIIGGLSILGTSGIVRPISTKAWTDTIDSALDVAKACKSPTVVLSTGRTSEMAAQAHLNPPLPEEAYIMMGDHVAYALQACEQRGFMQPLIACQFAKLLKIACGHANTHAAASELDLKALQGWCCEAGLSSSLLNQIEQANTARQIIIDCDFSPVLLELVCAQARNAVSNFAPSLTPIFLVAEYNGKICFQK